MRLIVFGYLGIGNHGVEQLVDNLLLVGIYKQIVAIFAKLATEVVSHVLFGFGEHHRLTHPLVNIVVNDGGAILRRHSLSHEAAKISLAQLVIVGLGYQRCLLLRLVATSKDCYRQTEADEMAKFSRQCCRRYHSLS